MSKRIEELETEIKETPHNRIYNRIARAKLEERKLAEEEFEEKVERLKEEDKGFYEDFYVISKKKFNEIFGDLGEHSHHTNCPLNQGEGK